MKRTFTQKPVIPPGWTGRDFNNWQKYVHHQLDKIRGIVNVKKSKYTT